MTADEAIALAAYQRPGVRLVVGPTEAREEAVSAVGGPIMPWWLYDLQKRLWFAPSLWAMGFARAYEYKTGCEPTDDEYRWLNDKTGKGASRASALEWLEAAHG